MHLNFGILGFFIGLGIMLFERLEGAEYSGPVPKGLEPKVRVPGCLYCSNSLWYREFLLTTVERLWSLLDLSAGSRCSTIYSLLGYYTTELIPSKTRPSWIRTKFEHYYRRLGVGTLPKSSESSLQYINSFLESANILLLQIPNGCFIYMFCRVYSRHLLGSQLSPRIKSPSRISCYNSTRLEFPKKPLNIL
jgi:hypothetical protein